MNIFGNLVKKIEKMADFQMRKSTHIRFLENCMEESVVPKGLLLEKKIMVGENSNLQETVDRALQKFSLELTRLVIDEHSRQLHDSKGLMLGMETDLKTYLNDEGELYEITGKIFSKIEQKKNNIVEKQQKKLKNLIDERDCISRVTKDPKKSQENKTKLYAAPLVPYNKTNDKAVNKLIGTNKKETHTCPSVSLNVTKDKPKNKPRSEAARTKKMKTTTQSTQLEKKSKNFKQDKLSTCNRGSNQANLSVNSEGNIPNQSKNVQSPGSKKNLTYAEAIQSGITTLTKKTRQEVIERTIQTLLTCLKELKETDGLSEQQAEGNGKRRRKSRKKSSEGKKQY